MPELFPFYHQATDRDTSRQLSKTELDQRAMDWEQISGMVNYRKRFEKHWLRGAAIYNIIQTATPHDEISRVFLGYTRMVMDTGISQMTEGEPDFSFEPIGPSDWKKTVIWKHLIKNILSRSNYRAHQHKMILDYHNMGNGAFEVFTDFPMRNLRIPNADMEDGFENISVRDFRRGRVGIRHVSPWDAWRNPNITDPTEVPSCMDREIFSWNQFAVEVGNAILQDGSKKYHNLDLVKRGTHVVVYSLKDEVQDVFRKYAIPFGGELDGSIDSVPINIGELGVPIFNRPLKIHEMRKNGRTLRSDGLNIPGMCNIRWATFNDQYDLNRNSQSVYGMGMPQQIEGLDMVIQELFNVYLDNWRMANTVVLGYEGNDAKSYMDVDANSFYGGELIDGKITPQSLGSVRLQDYPAIQQVIDNFTIPITGTNYQHIVGDTSKTAFEFAQRIRANNRRAEQKLRKMEDELFKPSGQLLLSGALTELTVDEFEDMTEEQVEIALEEIKMGRSTAEDFRDLTSKDEAKPPQRKVRQFIKMQGESLREDFTGGKKKRKLDFDSADNTLVEDKEMKANVSFIPLVKEYVIPAEYIESGLLPDVMVDSKRMLGDMKAQDVQTFQSVMDIALGLRNAGYDKIDLGKLFGKVLEFAEIPEKEILQGTETTERESMIEDALKQMETLIAATGQQPLDQPDSPIPNAQLSSQALPTEETELPTGLAGGESQPPQELTAIANSAI